MNAVQPSSVPPLRTAHYRSMMAERKRELSAALHALYPTPTELLFEIGSGHGHFLTAYAAAHPARACLGIDIIAERVARAMRKRDRAKLTNLHFLHAEARLLLDCFPAHVRLADVFILFPDPWPKVRHHKHRIMQSEVLRLLAQKAAPGSRLHFRTDHVPYFEATETILKRDPHWELVSEAWPFEFETVFQSRAPAHQSAIARVRA